MYGNHFYGQNQRYQPVENMTQPYTNPYSTPSQLMNNQNNLLGKSVDSIDVVKAIDIPLDGSVSYFPLTDNSAIVTKQLMSNGTSKITIFKPEVAKEVVYATTEDLDVLKNEIKELKNEIKNESEAK